MTDEELIQLYRQYKTKRIIIIMVILFFILMSIFIVLKFPKNKEDSKKEDNIKLEETVFDKVPPDLKLTENSIEIFINDNIDYLSYIESAVDDIDGDLKDKVQYNEVDTSVIGEQKIIYHISDSSGNESKQELSVNIKEKPEEDKKEENSTSNENNQENKPNTQVKPPAQSNNTSESNNSTPKQETPSKSESITKYFMFKDGYTMENVTDACVAELKKYNRTGMCIPIQDESGIYLGMKLEIK